MPITEPFPAHTPIGIVQTFSRGYGWFPLDPAYETCDQYVSEFTTGTAYEDVAVCQYMSRYDECFCIDVKSPYYTIYMHMTNLAQRVDNKQVKFSFPDGILNLLATTYGTWDLEQDFSSCQQNAYAYITEEDGVLSCYGTSNPDKCDCRLIPYDINDKMKQGKGKRAKNRKKKRRGRKRRKPKLRYPEGIMDLFNTGRGRWKLEKALFDSCEENAYAYIERGENDKLSCSLDKRNRCRCLLKWY